MCAKVAVELSRGKLAAIIGSQRLELAVRLVLYRLVPCFEDAEGIAFLSQEPNPDLSAGVVHEDEEVSIAAKTQRLSRSTQVCMHQL
jgi:hypothetical protein